jgi:tricarballylate dehydrogenase
MAALRVIVVGGGNAGLCAALAARERGAEVVLFERATGRLAGGDTGFTAGAMRVAYRGAGELRTLLPEVSDEEIAHSDFGSYPLEQFLSDLAQVTESRTDPELAFTLASRSYETLRWLTAKGVRFLPSYRRQAFEVDGRFGFWGGLTIEASGGGQGLIQALTKKALGEGVTLEYGCRAVDLLHGGNRVHGIRVLRRGVLTEVRADAVILACGGFQANTEWRTRYLGPPWDIAKVRGTRYNLGDGHRMALEAGASPHGNWSGCHAVAWDLNAPEFGDPAVGDGFQKHSYPFGIMVNAAGRRFVDEGADFRNYTYAKYGREILAQPGHFAWQVFDHKAARLLRDEYRIRQVTKVTADTLKDLAGKLDGIDRAGFLDEVTTFNAAVQVQIPFNPNVRDGRCTVGLPIEKSNWASPLDQAPFEAYAVTGGITFTFGGVRINANAQVLNTDLQPLGGLFAAGEIVGGIFYFNYPGGSGLTAGSVFGRIAGHSSVTMGSAG